MNTILTAALWILTQGLFNKSKNLKEILGSADTLKKNKDAPI